MCKVISCASECGNREDSNAMATKKEGNIVGKPSLVFAVFIRKHDAITCTITGTRISLGKRVQDFKLDKCKL